MWGRGALWAASVAIVAAAASAAWAEAPTVRDVARIVGLSAPTVSPDGKHVAFIERRADLEDDLGQ